MSTATPAQSELNKLRERQELAQLKLDVAELELASSMLPSLGGQPVPEAWGQPLDPLEWVHADPEFGRPIWGQGALPGDREHGAEIPIFQTEGELSGIRAAARLLTATSANAKCALRNLTNFVMGTGFTYKANPVERDRYNEVAAAVQAAIDRFIAANRWQGRREREAFRRGPRDGEVYIALYHRGGGAVTSRFVEPEQITEPQDTRAVEEWVRCDEPSDWSFGVHTVAGDTEDVRGYHVQWSDNAADFDYIPADRMQHIKRNVDGNIKRGLSDFYPVRKLLETAAKLLRNMGEGASVQAAIAFIREHAPGASHSQINSSRLANKYRQYTESTPAGDKTRYMAEYKPGTILDAKNQTQYKPGPLGASHGPNFVTIEQAILRVVGTNWCMPEYLISGDASNANYSSTMVAESPFVKNCEAEQAFYAREFEELLWKVIQFDCLAGGLGRLGFSDVSQIKPIVNIEITGPEVAARDQTQETERRQKLHDAGILSPKTWTAEEGYDYDVEQEQGAKPAAKPTFGTPFPESREDRIRQASRLLWGGYP